MVEGSMLRGGVGGGGEVGRGVEDTKSRVKINDFFKFFLTSKIIIT